MADMREETAPRHCEACGADAGVNDSFCTECGLRFEGSVEASTPGRPSAETSTKDFEGSVRQANKGRGNNGGASASPRQPTRRFLVLLVGIVLTVAASVRLYRLIDSSSAETQALKVEKILNPFGGDDMLQITNVAEEDIEITDITINDRDDCTMFSLDLRLQGTQNDDCAMAVGDLSPSVRHQLWVLSPTQLNGGVMAHETASGDYAVDKTCTNRIYKTTTNTTTRVNIEAARLILKIGDVRTWMSTCRSATIRTTIQTDHGTGVYHWE
jgi:hypothetical protein